MDGSRLKTARLKANHTQASLAEMMNTDARQIWRWENSENVPNGDVVKKLAITLQVSSDYLLGITSDPSPVPFDPVNLTPKERAALNAWRHGDIVGAIKMMVNDG